jgi:hypothetical protein
MQTDGVISGFNSANLPLSRGQVSEFLVLINTKLDKLSSIDKEFLADYKVEFEYEITKETRNQNSFFPKFDFENMFSDKKQKYVYYYTDSNATAFVDVLGNVSYRTSTGDSLKQNSIVLGDIGFRLRGTLFNSLGYYILATNGQKLSGKNKDVNFASATDPFLKSSYNFTHLYKNFDLFRGYLRYQTKENWLALTVGREALYQGTGYIDKLFLSGNTEPYDFIKLDLNYKAFKYSFTYGALKGDSLGVDIRWKTIATHRLDILFSRYFKMGFSETIIGSNNPFEVTYLNPMSFLISADYSRGQISIDQNNALMGLDIEINPIDNLAIQGTFIIDDINLSTLGKSGTEGNDNKFAYQAGLLWTNAFTLPNLTFSLEYTRLDPFVYSHRSNKNQYTNYGLSLGHALQPNSDEVAANLKVNVTSRINFDFLYQFQRSGGGYEYDIFGNILMNYGGDINRGDKDFVVENKFLMGNRVNKQLFTTKIILQLLRQYYISFKHVYRFFDLKYASKKMKDNYFFLTFTIDY